MKKYICIFTVVMSLLLCAAVFGCVDKKPIDEPQHVHEYSDKWQNDDEYHWHESICEHAGLKDGKAPHVMSGEYCAVCGYYRATPPIVEVQSVELDRVSVELTVGESVTLRASVFPADAADKMLVWSCSGDAATVVDGTVTGVKQGTATVTATASNGAYAQCQVNVAVAVEREFEFEPYKSGCALKRYIGNKTTVTVPAEFEGKSVVAIGDNAFGGSEYAHSLVQSVSLPESIEEIGDNAFAYCSSLNSINLPVGVKTIGAEAFYGCNMLKFPMPMSLESIGERAFMYSGLTDVTVPSTVTSIGMGAFFGCELTQISVPFVGGSIDNTDDTFPYLFDWSGSASYLDVPETLETVEVRGGFIPRGAFASLENIKSVSVENCIGIGNGAFRFCASLSGIALSGNMTSIGDGAFESCVALESVSLPSTVTSLGESAFKDCAKLTSVNIPKLTEIKSSTFAGCAKLSSVVFPNTLKRIGSRAFAGSGLTAVDLPNGVEYIENGVFEGCAQLVSASMPNSVTYCEYGVFDGCLRLSSVKYSDNVSTIPQNTFGNCAALSAFSISSNVTTIEQSAFEGAGITELLVPSTVINIGFGAFKNCDKLESITLPFVGNARVPSLECKHFGYIFGAAQTPNNNHKYVPQSLKHVTVAGGIISQYAFSNMSGNGADDKKSNIETITVQGDTETAQGAFGENNTLSSSALIKLNKITLNRLPEYGNNPNGVSGIFGGKVPSALKTIEITSGIAIPDDAFSDCLSVENVVLPSGIKSIGDYAFAGCAALTEIDLPSTLETIGDHAFNPCRSLKNIAVPDSVKSIAKSAFGSDLTSISLPFTGASKTDRSANTHFGYVFGAADSTEHKTKVPETLKTVTITGDADIADAAFAGCNKLTSVTLSDSVRVIGDSAFSECAAIAAFELPRSLETLKRYAFNACTSLRNLTVHGSLKTVGEMAFYECSLMTTEYTGSIADWCGISFGDYYANPKRLSINGEYVTELVVPDTVTAVGAYAFCGMDKITSAVISNKVKSIGIQAFYYCDMLTSITLPFAGEKSDGTGATNFGHIFGAVGADQNSVYVPQSLETVTITSGSAVAEKAFYGCDKLKSITISASVTSMGDNVFGGCTSLQSLTTPFIGYTNKADRFCDLFGDTQNTQNVPSSLKIVAITRGAAVYRVFSGCENIEKIIILDGTAVAEYAFAGCTALTEVRLSATVTSLGDNCFYNNTNLKKIVFDGTMEQWNAVQKTDAFGVGVSNVTVQCSDGNMTIM